MAKVSVTPMSFIGDRAADAIRIRRLGGTTAVARLMQQGGENDATAQRVNNWLKRGIPAAVKLQFPALFLVPLDPPSDGAGQ